MKKSVHFLLVFLFFFAFGASSYGQCDTLTEANLKVIVHTDSYPYETSWEVVNAVGVVLETVELDATYQVDTEYSWEVCIPKEECVTFTITDDFGDGIEIPGYYAIEINGVEVLNTNLTSELARHDLNCPPGLACNTGLEVGLGPHQTSVDDNWYRFTPQETGQYTISTCNLASCDTKIWIFENCNSAHNNEDNEGTLAFDDDFGGCGKQATITTALPKEEPIYIRIGDDNGDCGGAAIDWEIIYVGPISGCTDSTSCNYSPLATMDDGSCLPFGDPACPAAPDLLIRQDVLETTAFLAQIQTADDCLVEEGCLNGFGKRDIIRFSTRIENIGDADYYIGNPVDQAAQFTFDNCHNHWHYDGYAEYILYDENGVELPIGFKNGFCVIDLGCKGGGSPQYNCANMGISAGCFDEYWADLECQWIDITDVEDGRYTFVTRVNWDNAPDALGRKEQDTLNNWAQICIILDRSSGNLQLIIDEECEPFQDCKGVVFGNATYDCAGVCEGTTKWGDLDSDGDQSTTDVLAYIDIVQNNDPAAANCMDLSGDGEVSVYDAALMADCAIYGEAYLPPSGGVENHCKFPKSLSNPNDTAGLTILAHDVVDNYFDIGIRTATANVVGYQFYMTGLTITKVESLVDPLDYPTSAYFGSNGVVLGVSTVDSVIHRLADWQKLVRVFHDGNLEQEICISEIREVVSQDYELMEHFMEANCVTITGLEELASDLGVSVFPNPFSNKALITFSNPEAQEFQMRISNINGKEVQTIRDIHRSQIRIDASDWPKGVYLYQLVGKKSMATGKLVVE